MFRRKKTPSRPDADERAQGALERLDALTDRLEDTTRALAGLVAELQLQEQGADRD